MPRSAPALLITLALAATFTASGVALRSVPDRARSSRAPLSATAMVAGPGNAARGCTAGNARDNTSWPLEMGIDYVPITPDDSLGFYVAYSARTTNGTSPNNNVGILVAEIAGGEVLVFGAGYGNYAAALNSASYDADNVDALLRACMGRSPNSTPIRFVSPHWHGDHINVEFIHQLENRGWQIVEILYHEDDDFYIHAYYDWRPQDLAKFTVIPDGSCNQEILSYPSPLGKIWFTARRGHAPGAIDLVIDVRGNPEDRFVVFGSAPGGVCPNPPDGTRASITAHGNVLLEYSPQVVPFGCGINPANSIMALSGTPRIGAYVVLGLDNPSGDVAAGAIPYLWSATAPDPAVPCGSSLDLPGMAHPGEVLLSEAVGDLQVPPLIGPAWTGPGHPSPFRIDIPQDVSLVGISFFYQGALIDPLVTTGNRIVLTDAVELRIGN